MYGVVVAAALACVAGFTFPSLGVTQHGMRFVVTEQRVERFTVSGTVGKVDYDTNQVTIHSDGKSVQVSLDPTTAVEDRGQAASIADIQTGRKITAEGVVRNGALMAQTIRLR